jgi:flagellar biosynthesis protein FlhB
MAENDQSAEKTEEGSEKKTRDAIEKGNVPFSREASVFCTLAAMLAIASLTLAGNIKALADALTHLFGNSSSTIFATPADTITLFVYAGGAATTFLLPILVILIVAGLIAAFAQGMPRVAVERIAPKWSKLSPAAGLKRFFSADGYVEFGKSLAKFAIVCVVIFIVLRSDVSRIVETLFIEPNAVGGLTLAIVGRLIAGSLVAFGVLTAGDLVWSRIRWRRELRMTKQEVKDEMKQAEGDPLMKAKRRSLALDRSRRRMIADVPKATLVIANPTHYAIALRYKRDEGGAPVVVAKGQDLIALKIREIAESHQIPVIEDKALARSMYDHVEVSQLIPPEFYKAVAELIHFLQARSPRAGRVGAQA